MKMMAIVLGVGVMGGRWRRGIRGGFFADD